MDYPKSVPSVGLVNGKFVDENAVNGTPGSLIPAVWGNAVTEELLNVVRAAQLSPSEGDSGQLLKSLQKMMFDVVRLEPVPLSALAFPTVATLDGRLSVVAQANSGAGKITVPTGVLVSIAEEVDVGLTGRIRSIYTEAWSLAELDLNTTYYVRSRVVSDKLGFYIQKGTDLDEVPTSMKGSVGGSSGGGFDSTCIDVLVAKVVTAAVGSVPVVTLLANKSRLEIVGVWSGGMGSYSIALNWARKPRAYIASFTDYDNNSKTDYSIVAEDTGRYAGGGVIAPVGGFSDRYTARVSIGGWALSATAAGPINARVRWEA